jgi:phytoene dehydrogenase-like protein
MSDRSMLIVGAGIGGLSTGCFAEMNGYRTRIVEMHSAPGGVCTSWQRNGYTFDGCVHNLAGTVPASVFHGLWQDLGVVPAIVMHAYQELVRVERPDGEPLTVHTDLDRLGRHLKELAPGDSAVIDELISASRRFAGFDLFGLALAGPWERARALAKVPMLMKYGRVTLGDFAQRFTDPVPASRRPLARLRLARDSVGGSLVVPRAHGARRPRLAGGRLDRARTGDRAALSRSWRRDPLRSAGQVDRGRERPRCRRPARGRCRRTRRFCRLQRQRPCNHLRHARRAIHQPGDPLVLQSS